MSEKEPKIMRPGKTRRDHMSGAHARRFANRAQRDAYVRRAANEALLSNTLFPFHVCNGKKNRYQVTGKNNKTIVLKK